jgi:hypothetical protein
MTPLQRGLLTFLTTMFVFCVLAVLAPEPRDPVRGDNRMIGAFFAAICAGGAVAVVT